MFHKEYERNTDGIDFVVGDIHGRYDLVVQGMWDYGFDKEKDRLFSVGDLIDRGPDNMKCLSLLKEPWFHAVLGNHEQFLTDHFLEFRNTNTWCNNGGMWHLDEDRDELTKYAQLINELPTAITIDTEEGPVGICHAEPPHSMDWNDVRNYKPEEHRIPTLCQQLIWGRTHFDADKWEDYDVNVENVVKTIHGHNINKDKMPKQIGNVHYIDTGAYYTNVLTLVRIDEL